MARTLSPFEARRKRGSHLRVTPLCYIASMRRVLRPFLVLLALIFLVEAWLWEHLRPLVAWAVDLIAWNRLKARLATAIERLPPYATLLIFLIPPIVLFPFKLLGLWMLAHGSWARRDDGAGAREARRHRRRRIHFRRHAAEAAAASLVPLDL
jgi:hypothetical protein